MDLAGAADVPEWTLCRPGRKAVEEARLPPRSDAVCEDDAGIRRIVRTSALSRVTPDEYTAY